VSSGRIIAQPADWKDCMVDGINDEIPDTPPEIVREFLTVCCKNRVVFWMPA
jgi:hypothetical protein